MAVMNKKLRVGSVAKNVRSQPDSEGRKRCQVKKTVRFVPDVAQALSKAARTEKVSLNKIVNEAVADRLGVDISDYMPE